MNRERIYSRCRVDGCESLRTRNSRQHVYRRVLNRLGVERLFCRPDPKSSRLVACCRTRDPSESAPDCERGRVTRTGRVVGLRAQGEPVRFSSGGGSALTGERTSFRRNRGRP